MRVVKILPEGFGCNSYIVTADGKNAVVIDCAESSLYDKCISMGLNPVALLLTHGHFDHVGGCGAFSKAGVPIYCGKGEEEYIFSPENRGMFGGVYIPDFAICKTLSDGEKLRLAGIEFAVISTPGHTVGGVSYLAENCLFTGDTLFFESIGRTDLPGGNFKQLYGSVQKLFAIDGNPTVYCGHEKDTSLDHERSNNHYVR